MPAEIEIEKRKVMLIYICHAQFAALPNSCTILIYFFHVAQCQTHVVGKLLNARVKL